MKNDGKRKKKASDMQKNPPKQILPKVAEIVSSFHKGDKAKCLKTSYAHFLKS